MGRQFDLQAANWNVENWNEPRAGRRLAVWAALSLACCALAYCSLFTWYPGSVANYGVNFRRALTWELLRWNLWLPVAALILRWNRAAPPRGIAAVLRYAASAILFPALHIALLLAAYFPFSPAGLVALLRHRAYVLMPDYLTGIVACGLVLGLAHAWRQQARAVQLETQLAQAQLEALKMQLQPHFLFNTLNAVAALQLEDPETARRMLVRLSDFLRGTLENAGANEVSLDREVDFVSRYLEIERVRFPKKLAVEIEIDPAARDALVPNLILQPIVENAIRHGIAAKACAGRVQIQAGRRNGSLQLRVRDTGPGLNSANPQSPHMPGNHGGRGLTITRARLEQMYGAAASLSLRNAAGGGLEVEIEIPFATSVGHAGGAANGAHA
jgi:two-component system, LytTR family, sensor kinase